MNIDVYRKVQREFDLKRQRKIDEANRKKEEIYASNPQLKKIEDEMNVLALKITKNILNADEITRQVESENMSMKLKALDEKLDIELKKIGYSKDDFKPKFDCKICEDRRNCKKRRYN